MFIVVRVCQANSARTTLRRPSFTDATTISAHSLQLGSWSVEWLAWRLAGGGDCDSLLTEHDEGSCSIGVRAPGGHGEFTTKVTRDGLAEVQTDFFANDSAYAMLFEDGLIASNELWSVVANVKPFKERPRQLRPQTRWTYNLQTRRAEEFQQPAPHASTRNHASLRTLLAESVLSQVGTSRTAVVLLSGGIDSSAVAVAARDALPPGRLHFLTAVFPHGYRAWEVEYARTTARRLGIQHHALQLRGDAFLPVGILASDGARHPWLGWWFEVQRVAAGLGDLALSGASGQWFGCDPVRLLLSGVTARPSMTRVLDAIEVAPWRQFVRETLLLRRTMPVLPSRQLHLFPRGHGRTLENPFAGQGLRTVCPYSSPDVLARADSFFATGQNVDKLELRREFRQTLDRRVTTTPRRGSPPLPMIGLEQHDLCGLTWQDVVRESFQKTQNKLS